MKARRMLLLLIVGVLVCANFGSAAGMRAASQAAVLDQDEVDGNELESELEKNVEITLKEDPETGELIIEPGVLERTIYLGDDDETGTITIHNPRADVAEYGMTILDRGLTPYAEPVLDSNFENYLTESSEERTWEAFGFRSMNANAETENQGLELTTEDLDGSDVENCSSMYSVTRNGLVYFTPNICEPQNSELLWQTGLVLMSADFLLDDFQTLYLGNELYNSNGTLDSHNLYKLNINTGDLTFIKKMTPLYDEIRVRNINFTSAYGFFYGIAYDENDQVGNLYKMDKKGNTSLIGSIPGLRQAPAGLVYVPKEDLLYTMDHLGRDGKVFSINPDTAESRNVSTFDKRVEWVISMDYDEQNETTYLSHILRFTSTELRELNLKTGRSKDLGFYPGGNFTSLAILAYGGVGGGAVPWIAVEQPFGEIEAQNSLTTQVHFSARSFDQPGTYHAELKMYTGIEYEFIKIPIKLHVVRPYNWGTIKGSVYGLERCDVNSTEISNAVVQIIKDEEVITTVSTDQNGFFSHSLIEGVYDLKVVADDFVEEYIEGLIVRKSEDAILDITLRACFSCMTFEPGLSKVETIPIGEHMIMNEKVKVFNSGACDAVFEIDVKNGAESHEYELILDDGTFENTIGLQDGGEFIWANQFVINPSWVPFSLESVQIAWGDRVKPEDRITIAVYELGSGGPRDQAKYLGRYDGKIKNVNSGFVDYLLKKPITFLEPTDIFIAVVNRDGVVGYVDLPAALDMSSPEPRPRKSWIGSDSNPIAEEPQIPPPFWEIIDDLSSVFDFMYGSWMIRGKGSTDEGDIVWLSVDPTAGVIPADGGELEFNLSFALGDLDSGTYQGRLMINDWPYPRIVYPVELNVLPPFILNLPLISRYFPPP